MARRKKIDWKRSVGWLGLVLLVPSLLLNIWQYSNRQREGVFLVREVLDGDTLVTEVSGRVRMASIDAPGLELCGGEEAKSYLESLILNKEVRLEFDKRDVYNRPLAYVFIEGQMVNELMLKNGLVEYHGGSGDKAVREELKDAYKQAFDSKVGIHGEKCSPSKHEGEANCRIKGNVGRNNNTENVYHFPGCLGFNQVVVEKFRGEQWFCSEKEAEAAGFVKSQNCYGKKFEK